MSWPQCNRNGGREQSERGRTWETTAPTWYPVAYEWHGRNSQVLTWPSGDPEGGRRRGGSSTHDSWGGKPDLPRTLAKSPGAVPTLATQEPQTVLHNRPGAAGPMHKRQRLSPRMGRVRRYLICRQDRAHREEKGQLRLVPPNLANGAPRCTQRWEEE